MRIFLNFTFKKTLNHLTNLFRISKKLLKSQVLKIVIKKRLMWSQILWTFLVSWFWHILFRSSIFICGIRLKNSFRYLMIQKWKSYHNNLMIYFWVLHAKMKVFNLNGTFLKPTCYVLSRVAVKPLTWMLIYGCIRLCSFNSFIFNFFSGEWKLQRRLTNLKVCKIR